MSARLRGYEISRPKPIPDPVSSEPVPPPRQADPTPSVRSTPAWPPPLSRPLSDIREITEPSLMDITARRSKASLQQRRDSSRTRSTRRVDPSKRDEPFRRAEPFRRDDLLRRNDSQRRNGSIRRTGSARTRTAPAASVPANSYDTVSSSSYSTTPEQSSCYMIPHNSVPRRSSSFGHERQTSRGHVRKPSIRAVPPPPLPPEPKLSVPNRGQSNSPVKGAGLRLDPITADVARRVPSRTHVRSPHPTDILDYPSYKHHRLKLELQVTAPIFVGGGTVEGFIKVTVDDNDRIRQRRTLGITALSVDILGYEEISASRRATFLALGTEVIDISHSPPASMAEPLNPLMPNEKFWSLLPSASALPFMISLPLDTGPPPFESKYANIRFMLSTTAIIADAGKHYRVRTSQDVQILPTYDPERALMSLQSPLTASDELPLPKAIGHQTVKVTTGMHRQVWVSGSTIFVDVHISNKSHKLVKRLDLSLERDILCYKHAAASTRSAGQARVCESNYQSMIAMSSLRAGSNAWSGIQPYSSETRTCDLELPRGHATVKCGKYFEVRYFLNITASVSNTKLVSVQLPIILIHMNSLDVVPNSVAQVAAAIEEKRANQLRRRSSEIQRHHLPPTRQRSVSSPARSRDIRRQRSYTQGRAFAAPRQQSLDRRKAQKEEIVNLRTALDSSPRKHKPQLHGCTLKKAGSTMSFRSVSNRSIQGDSPFRAMTFQTPSPKLHPAQFDGNVAEGVDSIRARMRRMASFDTLQSKVSARSNFGPWHEKAKPAITQHSSRDQLAPHTLGLTNHPRQPSFEVVGLQGSQRSAIGQSFRERMDQSRFEFKGVRRKASRSSSIKERGMNWWETVRQKAKEREGWI